MPYQTQSCFIAILIPSMNQLGCIANERTTKRIAFAARRSK
jgi:hypothetical protein